MNIRAHFVGGIGHLGENPVQEVLADFTVSKESSLATSLGSPAEPAPDAGEPREVAEEESVQERP